MFFTAHRLESRGLLVAAGVPSEGRLSRLAGPRLTPKRPQQQRRGHSVKPAAAADPYSLLGVKRGATADDIKKAFRKRALKLHPDVNKAPDARERFMEAKEAYQQLLDESQGRGSKTNFGSGGRSSSASTNSSSWGYRDTTASRGAANQQSSQRRQQPPEETYSFGDMLRDLDAELAGYAQRRRQARGRGDSASSAPKSLWEELYGIGEELVEALEKGFDVSDDEAKSYGNLKKKYGDLSGRGNESTPSSSSSNPAAARASSTRGPSTPSGGASSGSAARSAAAPKAEKKLSTAEYVDEELAALKRKLGKK
ncbi:hypothetical protein D9Q98_004148 [Chlorella vulgaris]|uniref:J domain-containing protein n=1 Tax=Chlorella vulgaris TaxID=3077 RepID=A0A9D4TRR6_CHLVU|nr:hypothetical protein D9Q98_004148 [Chlorella vulgaris]